MTNGIEAFEKCSQLDFKTVLDVGAGNGSHSYMFKELGKQVTTVDFNNADITGNYIDLDVGKHDLVWCCHVLEHQLNINQFLTKLYNDCNKWLAVTVPPLKHEIVGGHLSLWNAGLLLYNLILAGFDCSQAMVKTYGYNISVIVEKKPVELPALNYDFGDIERLSQYFPFEARQGFYGEIQEINW